MRGETRKPTDVNTLCIICRWHLNLSKDSWSIFGCAIREVQRSASRLTQTIPFIGFCRYILGLSVSHAPVYPVPYSTYFVHWWLCLYSSFYTENYKQTMHIGICLPFFASSPPPAKNEWALSAPFRLLAYLFFIQHGHHQLALHPIHITSYHIQFFCLKFANSFEHIPLQTAK